MLPKYILQNDYRMGIVTVGLAMIEPLVEVRVLRPQVVEAKINSTGR